MNSCKPTRISWRTSLGLPFLALLPLLPGPADADQPAQSDPLPLRRIRVAPARVPAELERVKLGVLVKLPRDEFEARVQRAARAGERTASLPRLTRAVYTARLDKNALVGNADWTVVNPGAEPAVLPLPDLNLALTRASFDDASPAVLGDLDGKTLGLLARPGKQSLLLDWSLRGGLSGGELHFDLQVPPCPIASLELTLPADHTPSVARAAALLSGPHPAGDKNLRTWQIQFAGRARVELVVRRPDAPGRPPALLLAQLLTTQQLTPQYQLARYEFQVEVLHAGVRELTFDYDPSLEPYDVTVARAELQGWSLDRHAQGNPPRRALTIRLREPFQGGPQPLRVSVLCLAPLLRDRNAHAWASPGMALRGAFAQSETLKLQLGPDVFFENWRPGHFRLTRTAPTPEGGRLLTLNDGGGVGPTARPQATVRTHGVDFLARQQTWWQLGLGGSTLTTEISCTVRRGGLLKLPVRVTGDWQVEEVRLEPREVQGNWVSATGKGSTLIHLDLARAVAAGETVTLTLRLHSAVARKVPAGGLVVNFPDVEPLGASLREGTLAVGVASAYRARVLQASAPPAVLEGDGPWGRAAPNFTYTFRGKAVTGRLRVLPQPPRFSAYARTDVQFGPGSAAASVRLQVDPVVGSPEAVDLLLAAPAGTRWQWSAGNKGGLVRGLRRLPALEAAARLLALGPRHPLGAALSLAAVPDGERWRLEFTRPLTGRETVTLEASLKARTGAGDAPGRDRTWDVPLVLLPAAESMEGELTLAPAGAELRDVRAHAVREGSRTGTPARPDGWRLFRYGPALFPGQWPALRASTRAAPAGRAGEAVAGLEACDRSELTTYVEPRGRLLHHFRFRVWNWRRPEGGRRDLPVWLPAGVRLLAARVAGQWLDRVDQQEAPEGLRVELPVPAGPQPHHFELVYAAPRGGPWWSPWERLEAPAPRLPVPAACFRRTWRLPPGVVPLGQHARRLPDSLGPGDRAPWWAPARAAWGVGRSWLAEVGPEFAPDAWAAAQRQQLAEAEQAVRRQHPAGKPWRLGEALERLTAGPLRARGPVVVDTAALREAGLGPNAAFPPSDAAGPDGLPPPLFAPLGLTYLPSRAAPLLTTRHQQELWQAAVGDARPVSGALAQAIAEAAAHGRDSSGRFQTVAYWLGARGPAGEDTATATLAGPVAALGADSFGAAWTEWEQLPGAAAEDELVVVHQGGVLALGVTLALLFVLVAWRGRDLWSGRWGLRLLLLWLVASFLALFWLPPALRDTAWWPALAGSAVALIWYVRAGWGANTPGSRKSTVTHDRLLKAGSGASAVLLLLSTALPAQVVPAGPESCPVLILPGADGDSVLVTPELLKRLDELTRRGQPPARAAVLLSADYTGRVVGERVDFTAEFQVYAPAGEAMLTLPLGGVELQEGTLWAGERVYPVALPAPQSGYAVPLRTRGPAGVNTLRLTFSVRLPAGAGLRELRFTVPPVPRSKLAVTLPQSAQSAHAVSGVGQQRDFPGASPPRVEADLGRDGTVLVRWQARPRAPRAATLEVRETYLWDLRPPGGALTAVLQYTVSGGTADHLTLLLPEGLAVRGVEVVQAGTQPEGSAAVRLKGWHLLPRGDKRLLVLDLQAPVAGEVQVTLGLLPRLTGAPGVRKLWLPTPPPEVRTREGLLAYTVEGQASARAPDLAVGPVSRETFVRAWQRLGLREPVRPTEAYSFRRRPKQGPAWLELSLLPQPVQARQEVRWRVQPRHADFRLTLTLTAAREELTLLEWDVPGAVTVAEVRGPRVDAWSPGGGRLQVWLRQPVKEKEVTVRLEVRGWVTYAPAPPGRDGTFRLPCLRLHAAALASNLVRVSASPDLMLLPGPERAFGELQRLSEGEAEDALSYRATGLSYRGEFLFRPSPVTAQVRTLGVAEVRDGALVYTGLLDFQIPHGELRTATVRLRNWEGEGVRLEAPRAAQVRGRRGGPGEWVWTLTLPPGVTRAYAARVTGTLPLRAGVKPSLPELSAPGARAGPSWLAVLGNGVRAEGPVGLAAVKDPAAELRAWPAEAERVRKEGAAWRVAKDGGTLRLAGRAAGAAPAQILYAEQEAAVTDLRHWVHQATYWLATAGGADLPLMLPKGARLLAAAVDDAPAVPLRRADGSLALALPAGEGLRVLRLRWAFAPGEEALARPRLEAPRFPDVPEPAVVWRVDVPVGYRLDAPRPGAEAARPAGPAAAELARADGQLRLCTLLAERLRQGAAEGTAAQFVAAQKQFTLHCRHAANLLAASVGASSKNLAERLQDLKQRGARLPGVTVGARASVPGRPAAESELMRTLFCLPERGLPHYWYGSGEAPRVTLTSLAEDRWRASATATELLLIVLAGVWAVAYLPRVRRWLWRLLPEQVVLLGWLGTQAFGLSPLGALLILGGVCARVGLVCVWIQERLRPARPDEPPTGSGFASA
jgi:hypothetical protein